MLGPEARQYSGLIHRHDLCEQGLPDFRLLHICKLGQRGLKLHMLCINTTKHHFNHKVGDVLQILDRTWKNPAFEAIRTTMLFPSAASSIHTAVISSASSSEDEMNAKSSAS